MLQRNAIASILLIIGQLTTVVFGQGTRGENPPPPDTLKFIPPVVVAEKVQIINGDTVFNAMSLDSMAEYPGGMREFYVYLRKNLKYPTEINHSGVQGKVVIDAVIENTGKISHVSVKNPTHSALDEEVIRVFSNSGNWIPGKRKGKSVHSRIRMPIYINWK